MKVKKILLFITISLFSIILFACKKDYQFIRQYYINTTNNTKPEYSLIYEKKSTIAKSSFNDEFISKTFKEETDLFLKNTHYVLHDTKIDQTKGVKKYSYYFNFKEFSVKISGNETKMEYLSTLDLDKNTYWLDNISHNIYKDKITITNNLDLVKVSNFRYINKISKDYNEIKDFLNNVYFDIELKAKEAYFVNRVVITKDNYDALTKDFNKLIKEIKNENFSEEVFNNTYAKLLITYKECKDNKVIGTKEYDVVDRDKLKKELTDAKTNLEQKFSTLNTIINKLTIINSLDEKNGYYIDNKLIDKVNFEKITKLLSDAKHKLVRSLFNEKDLNQVAKNIKEINEFASNIGAKISELDSIITTGSKEYSKKQYKVEIYHNDSLVETKELSGNTNTNIVYEPETLPQFDIDATKSFLQGFLSEDKALTLKVYYKQKKLIIPLDLGGGKINGYNKEFIELNYGDKLDSFYNKIKSVLKANDLLGSNYQFEKLVNAHTDDEIDNNYVFTSEIILKVIYSFTKIDFNYQVEYYLDDPNSDPKKPSYYNTPSKVITSGESVKSGDHVVFDLNNIDDEYKANLVNGNFILDQDESVLAHSRIKKGAKFKIYLKRKKLNISINSSDDLSSLGLTNNRKTVKYGAYFAILPERYIKKISDEQYEIFDKLVNTSDNSDYTLGSTILSNIELDFITKVVNKNDVATISYYKDYRGKLHNRVQTSENLYIEKNTKIKDPVFFKNIDFPKEAQFDLATNKGYIKNTTTGEVANIDDNYMESTTLEFVYRLSYDQLVKLNQLKIKKLDIDHLEKIDELKDKIIELKATVNGITKDNKYYILKVDNNYMLLDYDSVRPQERLKLANNNEITIAGTLGWGAQEYFTNDNKTAGRFYSFVMKADPKTPVNIINLALSNDIDPKDLANVKENYIGYSNIDNLNILSRAGEATKIEKLSNDKYYQVMASDSEGNITYLLLNEKNNKARKLFLELRKGNVVSLKNVLYAPFRVARIDKQDFINSGSKHYNSFIIDDIENELVIKNNEISVNYELVFPKYDNWTNFDNSRFSITFASGTPVAVLMSLVKDNFYNGYVIDTITRDGEVLKENDILLTGDNIKFNFKKDEKTITFYYASYITPEEMSLYTTFIRDGKEYLNKPVDYDDKVYKFVFSYDFGINYLELKMKYGSDLNSIDLVIGLSIKDEKKARSFVAFEATKYSLINHRFGTTDTNRFSYQWGDILPYELQMTDGKLNKGMFVHAFTTSLDFEEQDKYANASLYSCIQIQSKGLVTADADYHINKDHNMPARYTHWDGSLFFQFHGNKTDEEIINNPNYEIKGHMGMTLKDRTPNGEVYDTNENTKYYFHKSSLHRYARFNKFGLSIVGLDLTPYVDGKLIADCSSSGKLYKSELSIEEQKEKKLSKSDDRIVDSNNFFNYISEHNLPILDNYFKIKREYREYEFILPNGYTFSNNESSLKYRARTNQVIDKNLLSVANLAENEEILFYDPIKKELVNFKNKFSSDIPTKLELIIAKKRTVSIRAYSLNNEAKLVYRIGFNTYLLNSSDIKDGYSKVYNLEILENNKYSHLFNNFYLGSSEEYGQYATTFQIGFNSSSSNYVVFEGSNKVLSYENNTSKLLLGLKKTNNLDNFNDAILKVKYSNGISKDYPLTDFIYYQDGKELGYFFIESSDEVVEAKLYKGPNLANNRNLKGLFKKDIEIKLLNLSTGERAKNSDAIFNNLDLISYYKLTITYKGIEKVAKVLNFSSQLNNYPININNLIDELSNYELVCYYKGSLISRDNLFMLTNENQEIICYYKPIYRPGEYNKVSLDLGSNQSSHTDEPIGSISGEITKYLFNNSFYHQVGKNLALLASATININPKWKDTKSFVGWENEDGNLVDLSKQILDGTKNIYLKARYNDLNTNSIVYYEEYIENPASPDSYNLVKKDQFSVINPNYSHNISNIKIPKGHTIDMAKSVLNLVNMNTLLQEQRIIKVYFKANRKELTFNLNGGEIDNNAQFNNYLAKHNATYNSLTKEIKFTLLYGRDFNSVLNHLFTLYLPKKDGVIASKVRIEYFGNASLNKELTINQFLTSNLAVLDYNMNFTFIYE